MSRERLARDAAIEHKLSATSAHVLLVLASYADDAGDCYPSRERLAANTRRGERQVSQALTDLKERGLIERRGRGPGRSVLTRLTCGQPLTKDARPTAPQGQDMRPAAPQRRAASRSQDVRPAAPRTPTEHPLLLPPLTPQGGRKRDHEADQQALADWTAEHLPSFASDPRTPKAIANIRRYSDHELTPDEIAALLRQLAPELESAAAA